jgi:hypothetical protein
MIGHNGRTPCCSSFPRSDTLYTSSVCSSQIDLQRQSYMRLMLSRRGRPAFQPTTEQRQNVEVMVGLGSSEEKICFRTELETGATKLNAKVGHFMITTIFGTRPPDGVTPITDQNVRGRLGELFLQTRLGWRDDLNQHEGRKAEWSKQVEDVRRRFHAKTCSVCRTLARRKFLRAYRNLSATR